ncbi:MAG: hypothetical protein KJO08_11475, partial [Gammaproteobacteria bacterium]|nr:hypothetical protein [Gammaproteobacteria bacterium]NNJ85478.1 hypothetical protein [Gammaproteobacteria bacterium]
QEEEFKKYLASGKLDAFISRIEEVLMKTARASDIPGFDVAIAFGLATLPKYVLEITPKGRDFFEWLLLQETQQVTD